MNRFFPTVAIVLTLVFNGSTAAFAQIGGFSNTGEGGRGLINMQSARTYGKGAVVFGVKSFIMERKTLVIDNLGTAVEKKDFPSIFCVPVAFGLTDEIDLTAALYGFHDARHWKYDSDVTLGYSSPVTGLGASSVGVKIRMPFALDSPVQIAGRFGAVFDTSTEQLDGMNYRWTRKGTDIETSFYETLDITSFLSLHLEQGYVLSGTEAYDDQFIGSAGLELHIRNWWTACCEVNNRTFLGTSPQSIFQAGNDPDRYYSLYGEPAIGNPGYIKDKDADFKEDFLVISPSLIFRLNGNISIDIGAHINIADQVDPKETFQLVGGFTFTTHVKSMIDTDRDGIKNSIDIEPDTPAGFPVDRRGKSLDTDRDGVPDGADREADTPPGAKTDDLGVGVDSDGDGVYDGVDIEPGTPSGYPVNSSGVALDDDGDGVPNPIDREPDTQKGATVNESGVSLDYDNDGVPDGIDKEPDTLAGAVVDRSGVSFDDDGDGVPNDIDEEPDTPVGFLVDKKGRALIKQEFSLLKEGLKRLRAIYFSGGNSPVPPESYGVLNEIGTLMLKYPSLKIQIEGHTDSAGDKAFNMKLARDRARNVLEHLLKHFPELSRDRFRVVGFGSDKPVASNQTFQGRKANRRVEFIIINQNSLFK